MIHLYKVMKNTMESTVRESRSVGLWRKYGSGGGKLTSAAHMLKITKGHQNILEVTDMLIPLIAVVHMTNIIKLYSLIMCSLL